MASEPSVAERAYSEIKRKTLAGEYRLHQRLDVTALAEELGTSTTPVREALVRLHAERLIAFKRSRGFFVSLWSEAELKALYEWRAMLLALTLEAGRGAQATIDSELYFPARVARFFQAVEARGNIEVRRAAINADERLHFARLAEHELFPSAEQELEKLAVSLTTAPKNKALSAFNAYHKRRVSTVRRLRERAVVAALGRNGD